MKLKTSALSLLPCLSSVLAGDVLNLGQSDFASTIDNADLSLVKFFAPWCGHCKKMAPEFEKAATTLLDNDPPVTLAEVDCTVHGELCQQYGVSGYPTLKVFRNGQASDYNGGRSYGDMVKIMAGQAGPSSAEVSDTDKLQKYLDSKTNVVMGFFESEKADGADAFQKAANELRESMKFAHSFDAEVAKAAGQEMNSIVLLRPKVMKSKFEEQVEVYDKEKYTVGLIRNWIKSASKGLAPVVEPADQESLGYPQVLAIYHVDYNRDPKGTQYWRNRVMKVAQNYKDISFGVASAGTWGGFLNELGVAVNKAPVVVAFSAQGVKHLMTEEFDPKGEAFTKFLDMFKDGKVPKHVKVLGVWEGLGEKKMSPRHFLPQKNCPYPNLPLPDPKANKTTKAKLTKF